jgi:hypothetical protein
MRVLRMHRDVHLLVTLTTLVSCADLPAFDIAWRTTVTPSTRTDFRIRLDRGVTTATSASLFATFFEGLLIRRAHPLSASYGNCSIFSFILSTLWRTFSPLGPLFLSVFVI